MRGQRSNEGLQLTRVGVPPFVLRFTEAPWAELLPELDFDRPEVIGPDAQADPRS